ncbi:glutamate--tRNA ligase [Candidatus Parcubacteria bacterium]|nr:glutamate--tRNA ligase [Candidatus Parcubacteria bacterium]
MSVRVRVAPSPTGFLHVGTAQSALYNWLFARHQGGKFFVRFEDTDKERSKKEFEEEMTQTLKWLKLDWDEEITVVSNNLPRHQEMLSKLLSEDKAFYCHHTKEELEAERKEQEEKKLPPRHVCGFKNNERGKEAGGIVRLKVDETSDRIIAFDDAIRGKVEFKQSLLGDFAIGRAADDPLYHFAVVVDDVDMKITHILRGEDHISNTPKHILIYEALGFSLPVFAHLPLLLGIDRSKLSKRHGDTAVANYMNDYLPEAIVNFLGCLGYTFSKEIISKEEMVQEFELAKVHKSGAIFDVQKLNWINSQWIKKLSPQEFKQKAGLPQIPDIVVPLITERLEKFSDAKEFSYLWQQPEYDPSLLKWKKGELSDAKSALEKVLESFKDISWDKETLKAKLDEIAGGDRGMVYWPLRAALSGKEKSPDPVELSLVLGKEEVIKRIDIAVKKLS